MLKPGLEIVSKGEVVERLILNRRETRVGRRDDNDVVLSNVSVSRHHAKILDELGHFYVLDLGSANGVLVNGKKIVERSPIKLGDEIGVGKFLLRFVELDSTRADVRSDQVREDQPAPSGDTFDVSGDSARKLREAVRTGAGEADDTRIKADESVSDSSPTLPPPRPLPPGEPRRTMRVFAGPELLFEKTIEHVPFALGRASDNDLILNKAGVSRYHAVIHRDATRFNIEDLGSRNGTFVNGEKVKSSDLGVDDEIKIGDFRMVFTAASQTDLHSAVVAAEPVERSTPDPGFDAATGGRTMVTAGAALRGEARSEPPVKPPAPPQAAPAAPSEPRAGRYDFPVKEVSVAVQYLGWVATMRFTPETLQRAEGHEAARDLVTIRLEMGDRVLSRTIPIASLDLEGRAKG